MQLTPSRSGYFSAVHYAPYSRGAWDAFVDGSRNGTFLFRRDYMEYHRERFQDFSLLVVAGDDISALFPANREGDTVVSHGGLTFGGLVLDMRATAARVVAMLWAVVDLLRTEGIRTLVYKSIPPIYHRVPTEEDRYALFRFGAQVVRRDLLTVISPASSWQPSSKRRWSWNRAKRLSGLYAGPSHDWSGYWRVLSERLREQYGVSPVHSLEEITSLAARFPSAIRLLVAEVDGEVTAGVVLYESAQVVHVQYLASNAVARTHDLLALVLRAAIEDALKRGKWFDFGASTRCDGTYLNQGLAHYKESFGGRTVVQDTYRLDLLGRAPQPNRD
jgi:hypothetical protein